MAMHLRLYLITLLYLSLALAIDTSTFYTDLPTRRVLGLDVCSAQLGDRMSSSESSKAPATGVVSQRLEPR
jgi:hypothetical protein